MPRPFPFGPLLALQWLTFERYLRNAAAGVIEGDPVIQGKAIVAAFFCSIAIFQTYLGPSFNPFTPIHNMLYMATGVPTPAQVAAAASTEKAKED